MKHFHPKRIGASLALGAIMTALLPVGTAVAAEEPRFELRPHCSEDDVKKDACKTFPARDAQSFQTDTLKVGDVLDMDLLIKNPGNASISRFRAWMGYDPTVFSGSLVQIDKNFAAPDPKETLFSTADGYIKTAASSQAGAKGSSIVAARITLKIMKAPVANTVISFYDATKKTDSHTAIIVKASDKEQNIASGAQSYLFVRLQPGSTSSSSSVTASSIASNTGKSASSTPSMPPASIASVASAASSVPASTGTGMTASSQASVQNVAFALLQVQGVRVTTEGSSAFLAWNQLNAGSLLGYNVYYGTVSGKYIQRRSVDKANTTLTIRSLPTGTRYYFAVRGVDAGNKESDFSQEVAVVVGNPSTSTSPLTGSLSDLGPNGKTPGTGGKVAGDTGPASTALLFIAISSVAGLALAFRRQFTAKHISLS